MEREFIFNPACISMLEYTKSSTQLAESISEAFRNMLKKILHDSGHLDETLYDHLESAFINEDSQCMDAEMRHEASKEADEAKAALLRMAVDIFSTTFVVRGSFPEFSDFPKLRSEHAEMYAIVADMNKIMDLIFKALSDGNMFDLENSLQRFVDLIERVKEQFNLEGLELQEVIDKIRKIFLDYESYMPAAEDPAIALAIEQASKKAYSALAEGDEDRFRETSEVLMELYRQRSANISCHKS